jgi:hypothetical protein
LYVTLPFLATLFAGCTSDDGHDHPGADLPCDVDDVFERNCRQCHASEPRYGAPMPLATYADLTAPAVSDPSRTVFELSRARIADPVSPMPPPTAGTLSDADRATLDAWFGAMAPPKPAGEACDAPDGGILDPGIDAPCEPTHAFLAHAPGSADAPFEPPTGPTDLYECFSFRSPFAAGSQASGWVPVIDDERVVHHMILYRTSARVPEGDVSECEMPSDAQFIAGWAPGGPPAVLPDDVGLLLGEPTDSFILQIHYFNAAGHTDVRDRSGLAFCTVETPRPELAGIVRMGSREIDLPPRSEGVEVTGVCPSATTRFLREPLHVLASGPHMHGRGVRFVSEIHRGGDPANVETLLRVDPFDFSSQAIYWHEDVVTFEPGDALVTRCIYDNPTDTRVRAGEGTEDEMCLNFVMAYPIDSFDVEGEPRCGIE